MKPGIIVTARLTSTRLPGKALRLFRDTTVLGSCLRRCAQTGLQVVLAVPDTDGNAKLRDWARENARLAPHVAIGSELNVLDRMVGAATEFGINPIIRITGDCPLAEPGLILSVLAMHLRGGADLTTNVWPRRMFAKGLDTEVIGLGALLDLAETDGITAEEQEHVTLGIYRNSEQSGCNRWRIATYMNSGEWPQADSLGLCVDTDEDLERLSKV